MLMRFMPAWYTGLAQGEKFCGILCLRGKSMRKNLITKAGMLRLKDELNQLWRVERPDVTKKVSWAASLGDRSENADYQYNKKRLREIDRRVRYLSKRVEELQVVEALPDNTDKIFFGAHVEVESEQGEIRRFQIVGYDEIFDRQDVISVDSPMAMALLQKEEGDEVIVRTPEGKAVWYVNRIRYGAAEAAQ
jgi:transcription elongation factor GreB